jgi:alanine-synthesizing transaminase
MLLSKRSKFVHNPIEEDDILAERLEQKGKKIIKLNRGDPAKYFPTPKYIVDAYIAALKNGNTSYSSAEGIKPLKDAIINRYKRKYKVSLERNDIIATAGVSEALSFLNNLLINERESAVIFKPYYPLYDIFVKMNGGTPILESYDEKNSWSIHIENLTKSLRQAKVSGKIKKIKYMIITNPNNPTGTVLGRKTLEEIVKLANEYGILLISDEIYDELVYNGAKFTSISNLAKGVPHVVLNGASKIYDSTGFRIGFAIVPGNDATSKSIKSKLYDYSTVRLSLNTPAQFAVAEAMNNVKEHDKAIKTMVKSIEERANHATKMLKKNQYLETVAPNGAFYILPRINLKELKIKSDKEFTDLLLEKEGIQVTRGSGFGAKSHFRIVALPPKQILDYSINRINTFCNKYSK